MTFTFRRRNAVSPSRSTLRSSARSTLPSSILDAEPQLLGLLGKWGDGFDDDQFLKELRDYIRRGSIFDEIDIRADMRPREMKLQVAERRVSEGRQHIVRQLEIIQALGSQGYPTDGAPRVLDRLEYFQRLHEDDLERLRSQTQAVPPKKEAELAPGLK
jgi:hypothetical protein